MMTRADCWRDLTERQASPGELEIKIYTKDGESHDMGQRGNDRSL